MATIIVGRSVPEWRAIVVSGFQAQPALILTRPQAQRLWGMDASTCGYLLDALVESGLLARTRNDQYCRPSSVPTPDWAATM